MAKKRKATDDRQEAVDPTKSTLQCLSTLLYLGGSLDVLRLIADYVPRPTGVSLDVGNIKVVNRSITIDGHTMSVDFSTLAESVCVHQEISVPYAAMYGYVSHTVVQMISPSVVIAIMLGKRLFYANWDPVEFHTLVFHEIEISTFQNLQDDLFDGVISASSHHEQNWQLLPLASESNEETVWTISNCPVRQSVPALGLDVRRVESPSRGDGLCTTWNCVRDGTITKDNRFLADRSDRTRRVRAFALYPGQLWLLCQGRTELCFNVEVYDSDTGYKITSFFFAAQANQMLERSVVLVTLLPFGHSRMAVYDLSAHRVLALFG